MNRYFEKMPAGTAEEINHEIPGYGFPLPITLIKGARSGPNVLINTGMHSGEYPGIPASLRAAAKIDPAKTAGNIFIIHCLNPSGFRKRTDSIVPEDGLNMNRIFPGNPTGSVSERIVSFLSETILPETDFVLDLHSGALSERLTDHLYFPVRNPARERSLHTASYLDFPYLTASYSETGLVGYAGNVMHIPGLLLERGHSGYCLPEWIDRMEQDIFNVLSVLGVLAGSPVQTENQIIFNRAYYTEAETEGLWFPLIIESETVRKGQLLGEIRDFRNTAVLQTVIAEENGIVMYYTPGLSVVCGSPLIAYGVSEERTE